MTLDPALLEILACPEDKGPLYYLEDEALLYNPRLHRRYDVRDGIPVMLIAESTDRRRRGARTSDGRGGRTRHHADLRHRLKPELILTEDNESAPFRIGAPVENVVSVW